VCIHLPDRHIVHGGVQRVLEGARVVSDWVRIQFSLRLQNSTLKPD
jgi:hypothetical protein